MKELNTLKNGKPCIYMIRNNINNKVYIGSAIGHYRRKGQHYYMLRRDIHYNKHLQSSWNKYKEENFVFEILEFIIDLNLLQLKEEYWIQYFRSTNPRYGYNHREDCKTNLNNKWSEESRKKLSISKKGITPNINYIDIAKKNMKKIVGININTNEKFYFNSILEASIKLNVHQSVISKAVNKKIKTSKGLVWDFVEKSTSNNSVNSGKIQLDNPDPSSMNDIKVIEKEQRLTGEESTNKPDTSAEQPNVFLL